MSDTEAMKITSRYCDLHGLKLCRHLVFSRTSGILLEDDRPYGKQGLLVSPLMFSWWLLCSLQCCWWCTDRCQ